MLLGLPIRKIILSNIGQGAASRKADRILLALAIVLAIYLALAYALAPWLWARRETPSALAGKPMTTATSIGIPGDALNVALEGSRDDVLCALRLAGWSAADPVTLRSGARIVGSVLARRAYVSAPVSPLFWQDRAQDLAFEKPSGKSPSTRHHVRFWLASASDAQGEAYWIGAVTYDRSVGVSHYTGQVTHHIGADIDTERDLLTADLAATGRVAESFEVPGVGPTLLARNGGGDPYFTDGEIEVSRLRPGCDNREGPPAVAPNAPALAAKATLFGWIGKAWRNARRLSGGEADD